MSEPAAGGGWDEVVEWAEGFESYTQADADAIEALRRMVPNIAIMGPPETIGGPLRDDADHVETEAEEEEDE